MSHAALPVQLLYFNDSAWFDLVFVGIDYPFVGIDH